MGLRNAVRPAVQAELLSGDQGEAFVSSQETVRPGEIRLFRLMEHVVQDSNIDKAAGRVIDNEGSPGVDGMEAKELVPFLKTEWPRLKAELVSGTYRPQPIRRCEISKEGGGVRILGIIQT